MRSAEFGMRKVRTKGVPSPKFQVPGSKFAGPGVWLRGVACKGDPTFLIESPGNTSRKRERAYGC
jgi:hypothetical protein